MPCRGPSDEECRAMERAENQRKYGKGWDNTELIANVACAYMMQARKGVPLPDYVEKWAVEHEKEDARRKQFQKNQAEAKTEADYKEYLKLKKRFG